IREVNPAIILTHSPSDYMMDHEQTSVIVRAAAFCAPIPNFDPSPTIKPTAHIPHLYYCDPIEGVDPMGNKVVPQFLIDITSTIETKAQMLAAHASQRDWLLKHHGMDQYLISMRNFAAHQGKEIGVQAAEGFRQHLGHSYPQDNILKSLLGS
ncbi:MAG: PIG-L family deacetylase, partial [Gemmataceae bacterium]|nr:PIG-L family deacetylase [Gemmataceae bacterium]